MTGKDAPDGMGSLRAAAVAGAGAAAVGALTLAGYADRLAGQGDASGDVVGRAVLVGALVVLCLAFAVVAAVGARAQQPATYAAAGAIGQPLLVVVFLATNWKPGWYFILDPNGAHPSAFVLVIAAGVQALLFAVAWARLRGRG
jgi:hypothetical protein